MFLFFLLLISLALFFVYFRFFKFPKIGCIAMVTGGVKCGKSMLSVWLAYRRYKRTLFFWKITCLICRLLKKTLPEKPLFYSNVPLAGVDFVLLPVEILERRIFRPAYRSVVYIQEASLLADSMLFKDMDLNERLLLFNKLFGHETHGGYLIYDTQCISDNHYAVKRCLNSYFWIHHLQKIPFFCVLFVREMFYSADDSTSVNVYDSDVEDSLQIVVIPKKIWKMYDAYCYSSFTDDLPVYADERFIPIDRDSRKFLKIKSLVSFKKFKTISLTSVNDSKKEEK